MEDKILRKRFQTTMIGALYEFEKTFGYLWGYDKPESEPLTEKEEKFLDLWEDTRNRVLNTGNNQLRKAITEIQKSSGKQTYHYRLPVRKGNYED
jgi:hypothetical protein